MKRERAIDILKEWNKETTNYLVEILNTRSIVTDEDETEVSSNMIESWSTECDDFLRKHGYVGSLLATAGDYFDDYGAVYAVYDTDQTTYEEVKQYLKKVTQ